MGGNSGTPFGVSPFMRALVYDPHAPANLRFDDVAEPSAADSQALIDVHAIALNFGELHFIDQMRRPSEVPGWDSAGIVTQAQADNLRTFSRERRKTGAPLRRVLTSQLSPGLVRRRPPVAPA